MTIFRFNAFRVELHPVNRMAFMGQTHDQAILCPCRNLKAVGQAVLPDDQGMVAGGPERTAKIRE